MESGRGRKEGTERSREGEERKKRDDVGRKERTEGGRVERIEGDRKPDGVKKTFESSKIFLSEPA